MGRKRSRNGAKSSGYRKVSSKGKNTGEDGSTVCNKTEENKTIAEEDAGFRYFEQGDVPIDVFCRLTYPLTEGGESCERERERESESENERGSDSESVQLNIRPRFVFVSSLCSICSEKSQVVCERCQMVSYCSTLHRSQGLSRHRDLCEFLTETRSSFASLLSERRNLDAERYRCYRLQLLANVESKVGRSLKLWEREIVLYPPICRVCRRICDRVICCARCAMESFCSDHAAEHEKWCPEYRVFQRCLLLQHKYGCVEPRIANVREPVPVLSELVEPVELAFDRLMHRIYGDTAYYRQMDCYTYCTLSHLCTIPLTALYAVEISCSGWQERTELTIHLLGAEFQFEGMNLHVWEKLFLHFLPKLRTLRLTLVGPELRLPSGVPPYLLSKVKLCRKCKLSGRAVTVDFRAETLYHELVGQPAKYLGEPDLLCAFNAGLYRKTGFAGKDSWPETIREFAKISAPIVITSYTCEEMQWEVHRLNSLIDLEMLVKPTRNPFASIKPDRNFVSDDRAPLIYKNYYLTVFKGQSS